MTPGLEGWRWVLAWTIASTVPVFLVILVIIGVNRLMVDVEAVPDDGAAGYVFMLLLVAMPSALVSGAGAAGQSVMLRALKIPSRAWITRSALATTVVTVVGVGIVSLVFRWTGDVDRLGGSLSAISLVQSVVGAVLVGAAQARLLRRAFDRAWLWTAIVVATALATRGVAQGAFLLRQELPVVFFVLPTVFPHLLLGVGMRWLLTRSRRPEAGAAVSSPWFDTVRGRT